VLMVAASVIEGALDVLIIVLALDLLDIGESGVGVLNSAVGAGGLLGALAAFTLVGRAHLARPFAIGLLLAGVPLAIVGGFPVFMVAILLFLAVGAGRSLMDVAARTILQRAVPDAALSRVLGVLEGLHTTMIAIGAITVPILIALVGPRMALVVAGLWLPVIVLVMLRPLRTVAATSVVRPRELALLRAIPMFAPLEAPALERLAARLVPVDAPASSWIIRQGEAGNDFFLIGSGEVEILIDGRLVRVQGPGEGFGEIALLRDVPRTASVRARTPVRLYSLGRRPFLEALTGHAASRTLADRLATERLAPSQ
jgi:MFS family permease